jgi:hypothetical protein
MRSPSYHYVALSLLLLSGCIGAAFAADSNDGGDSTTLYRWVDAQGVTHFSDTPQPGAEKMQVAPAQTYASTPVAGSQSAIPGATAPAADIYQVCDIATPSAQQSFYSPEVVGVSVHLVPELRDGDQLSVSVDGRDLPPSSDDASVFQIANPDRGAHVAEAVVRDATGHTLCSSMSVTFYVRRPSLLSPLEPSHSHGSSSRK